MLQGGNANEMALYISEAFGEDTACSFEHGKHTFKSFYLIKNIYFF